MAQGDFTKQEATLIIETFTDVMKKLSKPKMREMLGEANDIYLFLEAARRAAPDENQTVENYPGAGTRIDKGACVGSLAD